jgi:hypothetical protein
MFPGHWIHAANGGTTTLYSPWFPRGGDEGVFTYELMVSEGGGTFSVDVLDKNTEDTGDGVSASASFSQVGSTDFHTSEPVPKLEELVRFKYVLTTESADATVLFRMLAPTWFSQAGVV